MDCQALTAACSRASIGSRRRAEYSRPAGDYDLAEMVMNLVSSSARYRLIGREINDLCL